MSWSVPLSALTSNIARPRRRRVNNMFDFLRRRRLLRRGLASKKQRRRRTRNELLHALESARYVKVIILAAFIAGLAFLIFNSHQAEHAKSFVIALLFFAAAIAAFWINRPKTVGE